MASQHPPSSGEEHSTPLIVHSGCFVCLVWFFKLLVKRSISKQNKDLERHSSKSDVYVFRKQIPNLFPPGPRNPHIIAVLFILTTSGT